MHSQKKIQTPKPPKTGGIPAARKAQRTPVASGLEGKRGRLTGGERKSAKTSTDKGAKAQYRRQQKAMVYRAACLLRETHPRWAKRLSQCCKTPYGLSNVRLYKNIHENGATSASFTGLVRCKSVWACPTCSSWMSAERANELNHLLKWSRKEGHYAVLLTLTHQHSKRSDLQTQVQGMADAQKYMRQSKTYRGLSIVGTVQASEITYGSNGWHPHNHMIVIMKADTSEEAIAQLETLRAVWKRGLNKHRMRGNHAAFDLKPADQIGEYIAKFGAAEELTLDQQKRGRNGSKTVWQLLHEATENDCKQSAALWREFAHCYFGRKQLVWSSGLKKLAQIEKAKEIEETFGDGNGPIVKREIVREWGPQGSAWKEASRRYVSLLAAAADGGEYEDLNKAEYGLTDAELWRQDQRERRQALVEDG